MKKDLSQKIPEDVKWVIAGIAISWLFRGPADAYFSLFLKEFGSSYAQIGGLIAFSKFVPLMISIPMGLITDKFSARKLVIGSLMIYLAIPVVYFMAGLKESIIILLIAIVANGFLKTVRNIAMDTYIKEKTPKELSVKVMSVYSGITSGFRGLGLIAGGFLVAYYGFHELFLFVCFGILIKLFIFIRVSEVKNPFHLELHFPHIHKMTFLDRIKRGFREFFKVDFRVMAMLILSFFCALTVGTMDVFMVLFIDELDKGLSMIGFAMGGVYASSFLVLPINKFARKFGKFIGIVIGFLIMAICMSVVALYSESAMWILFISFFLHMLLFKALVKSTRNGILVAFTPRHMQGELGGIQNTLFVLGGLIGAAGFGIIGDKYGLSTVFGISATIYVILAIFIFYLWIRYEHTVKHVKVHPHGNILTMMHIGDVGHALPDNLNQYFYDKVECCDKKVFHKDKKK